MIEFVPASSALAQAFYGKPWPFSFRGWVCLIEGEPAGICGLYNHDGHPVAFSDIGERFRNRRKAIVRGIHLVRDMIEASPIPVYAKANPDAPTAPAVLAKLGFRPTGHDDLMVRLP